MYQQTDKYIKMRQKVGYSRLALHEAMNFDSALKERRKLDKAKKMNININID